MNQFNQAQGSPCVISLMKNLLGENSFTKFRNDILKGVEDLNKSNLKEIPKTIFTVLKRPRCQSDNVILASMFISQILDGFRK